MQTSEAKTRSVRRRLISVGIVLVVVFLGLGSMMGTATERGGAHSQPLSSALATSSGLFVKKLTLDPSYFVLGPDTARIIDAWVEKATRVKCRFFGTVCTREPIARYAEAFTMNDAWSLMSNTSFVEGDSIAPWSHVVPGTNVMYREVDGPLPDVLRLGLCEYKTYGALPNPPLPRPFLPDCSGVTHETETTSG
jgi:hypothetical protein